MGQANLPSQTGINHLNKTGINLHKDILILNKISNHMEDSQDMDIIHMEIGDLKVINHLDSKDIHLSKDILHSKDILLNNQDMPNNKDIHLNSQDIHLNNQDILHNNLDIHRNNQDMPNNNINLINNMDLQMK